MMRNNKRWNDERVKLRNDETKKQRDDETMKWRNGEAMNRWSDEKIKQCCWIKEIIVGLSQLIWMDGIEFTE